MLQDDLGHGTVEVDRREDVVGGLPSDDLMSANSVSERRAGLERISAGMVILPMSCRAAGDAQHARPPRRSSPALRDARRRARRRAARDRRCRDRASPPWRRAPRRVSVSAPLQDAVALAQRLIARTRSVTSGARRRSPMVDAALSVTARLAVGHAVDAALPSSGARCDGRPVGLAADGPTMAARSRHVCTRRPGDERDECLRPRLAGSRSPLAAVQAMPLSETVVTPEVTSNSHDCRGAPGSRARRQQLARARRNSSLGLLERGDVCA